MDMTLNIDNFVKLDENIKWMFKLYSRLILLMLYFFFDYFLM
jgi:hypothetical protein